jgi:hypothetical protein
MKNSKDKVPEPDLPVVDYSKLPPEIEEAITRQPFKIEKKTKLTWDGNQFSMRIPTEIAKEMLITKDNQVIFRLTKPLPGSDEKLRLEIELV